MRVYWIASFPKCGNTWVRFLLYQYLHGEATSSAQIAAEIPDADAPVEFAAAMRTPGRKKLFAKTHFLYTPTMRGTRHVYIIRHPRDVLLSAMNFARLMSKSDASGPAVEEQLARKFMDSGLAPPNTDTFQFGTIEQNWRSWLDQTRIPGIVVRYEDLHADTLGQLRRIVEHFEEPFDEQRAVRAVELSSFDRMRAMEVRERTSGVESTVFVGKKQKHREGVYFMNKGRSGRSLDAIAPGLDAACEDRFRETIERFGYSTPRGAGN